MSVELALGQHPSPHLGPSCPPLLSLVGEPDWALRSREKEKLERRSGLQAGSGLLALPRGGGAASHQSPKGMAVQGHKACHYWV